MIFAILLGDQGQGLAKAPKANIGPKIQNDSKSHQIQPSFRVDFGSPFVHLTKVHRGSEHLIGARLFILAISAPGRQMLLQFEQKTHLSKKGLQILRIVHYRTRPGPFLASGQLSLVGLGLAHYSHCPGPVAY